MSAYFRTLYAFSSKFILVCLRSSKKLLQKFASLFTFYFNAVILPWKTTKSFLSYILYNVRQE